MSETGPQGPTEPTIEINPNIKLFLEDLPREGEGEKKRSVTSIMSQDGTYLVFFAFNENIPSETALITLNISFGEKDLIINKIKTESQQEGYTFSKESLKIIIAKAAGKFSRIIKKDVLPNEASFYKGEEEGEDKNQIREVGLGFRKCEGENNDYELVLEN